MIGGKDHVIEFSIGVQSQTVQYAHKWLENRFPGGTWEEVGEKERFYNVPAGERDQSRYIHVLQRENDLTFVTDGLPDHDAAIEELARNFEYNFQAFGVSFKR